MRILIITSEKQNEKHPSTQHPYWFQNIFLLLSHIHN